ncbi:MAG: hypothetical protein CV045_10245 [Cyanobacteria bacterium M5B4]|nr:MAG: hypothetical protein CV045_10245 [Cyanobacteria bacterium M5B4]
MPLTTALEIYSICTTIGLIFLGIKLATKTKVLPQEGLLDRLLPLLIQYPTLRQTIAHNPQLPAKQLLPLLALLDAVADYWHLEPIGEVWQPVPYNPQLHQADTPPIQPGEIVYVRFIGYRSGDTIYAPAKVSRQLPPNALRSN